ncbi:hypothetical protein [Ilumatobacter nonamiensis]|uniref:hypothetical protein n=1 Tax=Ilumatobacter nonamiensis TaxID=467093 RepID=UPI000347D2EF|nr:hypothetical protein [Ilumatobacter nonamiensis]
MSRGVIGEEYRNERISDGDMLTIFVAAAVVWLALLTLFLVFFAGASRRQRTDDTEPSDPASASDASDPSG